MISLLLKKLNKSLFLNIKSSYVALFFVMLSSGLKAQVASNYNFQESQLSPVYADLVAATKTQIFTGIWNDNAPVSIPIGFTFNFNGANYTNTTVSPNGFITFGATNPTATNYTPISSTESYSGAISAYGANLSVGSITPATGTQVNSVSYFLDTTGGAGNSILKIEWGYFKRVSTETNFMRMQIWLYQNGNVIEIRYKDATTLSTALVTGQIGLRGAVNTDFNNRKWAPTTAANWPALPTTMTAGTLNTDVVQTKNNILPNTAANRLFRWSPVTCFAPSGLVISSITANTANLNWNAASPAPGLGYDIYVTSSGIAPNASTAPTGSVGAGVTNYSLTSLLDSTTYQVYVRSKCSATDTSAWSILCTFTTLCVSINDPYYNYFGEADAPYAYTVPAMLPCHSIQNVGVGPLNVWQTSYPTPQSTAGGFIDEHLVYDATTGTGGTDDANVWFFTPGFNMTAGETYKLDYMYGGSTETSTITNKMLVKYGTSPTDAAMTAGVLLADHNNIKASPLTNYVSFTASTTGVYYIGFKAYSLANNGRLFLDNIELTRPGCIMPTAVVVSNVTSSSATVSWTAPIPAPIGGYAYYVTTSPTPPSYSQAPTGLVGPGTTVVNLSGLTGSTTYYVWIRSKCNPTESDYSDWSTVQTFTTLFQPSYCIPVGSVATSYFNNFVTTGGIANISNASGYSPTGYGVYTSQFVSQSAGSSVNINFGISGPTVGVALWVDWNNDGIFSTAERMYNTGSYVSTASGSFTVPGGQPLGDYRMRIVMDYWATSPAPCAYNSGGRGETEDYTFRVVTPPPPLALNINTSTQCASVNSPLIQITPATVGNFNTYTWSPSIGVTGNSSTGYIINSNTTINYTLTGTQTVSPYSTRSVTFSYIANPLPTPITVTPGTVTVCANSTPTQINATGGIVSGIAILSEDFNSGAPLWTMTNSSTGGNVSAPSWTIRNSGYNPAGSSGVSSVISNDGSQFIMSNSDAQGSGTNTYVTMTSPSFSLSGYTNASLSFFHYYKPWINGSAKVEIYSGTTWTTLQSWGSSSSTTAQGTSTAFANPIFNLNAYVGQSGLQIRFTYQASWGFIWAIDNFLVSGSASSAISWNTQSSPVAIGTPVPGLFSTADGSTPYIAGTGTNTVYVSPNATTVYSATASTPSPVCSSIQTLVANTIPVNAGVASSDQSVCIGLPSDLTLTGTVGTIVKWQYSNTLAFTTPVDIPSSNSATLTTAQIGPITADRYFRAVVTSGSCTGYSNIIKITFSSTTWDGSTWSNGFPNIGKAAVFNADYDSTGDMEACSVTVLSGETAFYSGHTLKVQNFVDSSGGTMRFEDASSLVQVNNSSVNTGNILYKRNTTPVKKFDYTYWSSPVASYTLGALSPLTLSDKYFAYDPVIGNWSFTPATTTMQVGKGYIVRSPDNFDPVTPTVFYAQFTGVPNNGIINTPIVGGSLYNLIGNPYPSAINIDSFFDYNGIGTGTGVVDKTIYLWTHNTPVTNNVYTDNDYATYNYMGRVGTAPAINSGINNSLPLGKVAAGQSFFIKGLINGNATFNNSMRVVGNNNQFFRNVDASTITEVKSRVWLDMYNSLGAYKQTLVGYADNATNDFDSGYDGELLDGGSSISFYSLLSPMKLAIQGKGLPFNDQDIIPLGYQVNLAGNYEIKLAYFDGVFDTQNIYLEDKLLNTIHNLKTSNYSFVTNEGSFDTRFVLRFTNNISNTNSASSFTENSVVVFKDRENIHINSASIPMDEVSIFDIRGSLLYSKSGINLTDFTISDLASSQQMILIEIKTLDGTFVTKKLIF
jgi:hypothetical protein